MKYRVLVLIAIILMALPLAVAFGQGINETLVRATLTGDVTTLNWALVTDSASIDVSSFLWAGLFEVDPFTAAPMPGLATWEISEDGLTYTFTIRDDAVWSDGISITANDVKFTYEAILSDKVESPRKARVGAIASLNVVDDKTFEVILSSVDCTIWGGAFSALRPLPAHKFAADFSDFMTSDFNQAPDVTSGPYIVEERQPDEFVRVVANPLYYKGEPKIPYILFRVIVDTAIINQALLAGEIDYAFMYPDQLEQLGDTSDMFNVFVLPLNNTPLLHLNWADAEDPQPAYDEGGNPVEQTPNKYFGDVRVRQAVMMGIDREAIMGTLGEGGGYMQVGPVVPAFSWAYNPAVEPWPYDPDAAAALLDEAGWVDQDGDGTRECHGCMYAEEGTPLAFQILYAPLVDLYDNIALIAQDQLGQLGFNVEVVSMEWGSFLNDVFLPQKFDAAVVGFGGGSEVDGIAYNILYSKNDVPVSGFNADSYVNAQVDTLLEVGRSMIGCAIEDRAPIYYEIQRIAREEVSHGFTVGTNQVHVMNRRILNYEPGPWNSYNNVESWEIAP